MCNDKNNIFIAYGIIDHFSVRETSDVFVLIVSRRNDRTSSSSFSSSSTTFLLSAPFSSFEEESGAFPQRYPRWIKLISLADGGIVAGIGNAASLVSYYRTKGASVHSRIRERKTSRRHNHRRLRLTLPMETTRENCMRSVQGAVKEIARGYIWGCGSLRNPMRLRMSPRKSATSWEKRGMDSL